MTKISSICLIFSAFISFSSYSSIEDLNKSAVEQTDACVIQCKEYYTKNNDLSGFNYIGVFTQTANSMLRKMGNFIGINLNQGELKSRFCEQGIESLSKCYSKDSATYSYCKYGAKWLTSLVTTDAKWIDMFSSCKDTCLSQFRNFCDNK